MIAFLAGVLFEFAYLGWIYCASRGWPLRTALISMFVGAVSFLGIREALASNPWLLILGYGVGSYLAAEWKRVASPTA